MKRIFLASLFSLLSIGICSEDVVVLKNGTQQFRQVESLPPINYSFGTLKIEIGDAAAVAFFNESGVDKMQVVTKQGRHFVGPVAKVPGDISYIVKSDVEEASPYHKQFTLVLKNGDILTSAFATKSITVSSAGKEMTINPNHIENVIVDVGIYGNIVIDGNSLPLELSFVKDKFLPIYISQNNVYVKIPWDQIEAIYAKPHEKLLRLNDYASAIQQGKQFIPKKKQGLELIAKKPETKQREPIVKSEMVLVPNGNYMINIPHDTKANLVPSKSPVYIVEVEEFYVDKYPVTNAQYKQFVEETGYQTPEHWVNGQIPAGLEQSPVINVSYIDAISYAHWIGKSLPTEVEWEVASRYAEKLDGNYTEWTSSSANIGESPGDAIKNFYLRPTPFSDFKVTRSVVQRNSLKYDVAKANTTFRCIVPMGKKQLQ